MSRNRRVRRCFVAHLESLEPRWLMSSDLTSGVSTADVSLQGSALASLSAASEPGASIALPGGASMVNPTFGSSFRSNLGGGMGYWDAASSWSAGHAPTAEDKVIIAAGDTLIIRDTSAIAHSITVHEGGKLVFATDVNTQLKVITLIVLGELEMGTAANPIAADVTANLVIRDVPIDTVADPGQWGNGLVVLGKIRVHGAVKDVSDNRLAVEPRIGDTILTFQRDVTGWRAGDKLFLPGTKQLDDYQWFGLKKPMEWENLTVASVSGKVVTLSSALTYDHLGARNSAGSLEFMAAVQNLTRNAFIRSENMTGTRGHTLFAGRADVDIRYARFGGLGRSKLGDTSDFRLPVQFYHLIGPTTPQSNGFQYTFIGNAVTCPLDPMPFKWGIGINNSHYGLIQNNDLNNWSGAGLVTITGAETQNVIEGNRVMRILGTGKRVDETGESGVGYWLRGPDNYLRNNIAADIAGDNRLEWFDHYAYGFDASMAVYLGNVVVPAFQGADPSQVGQGVTVNMNLRPFREFRGNEAFATYNGMTLWWLGTNYESPGDVESQLKDVKIWNTYNWGMFLYESNRLVIDNLRFFSSDTTNIRRAIHFADYMARQTVIQNSQFENGWIALPTHTDVRGTADSDQTVGRLTIKDATFVRGGLRGGPPSSVNGGSNLAKRVVLLMNVQFQNAASAIWLSDQPEPGLGEANLNVDNYVVVQNYNSAPGVDGEDFIVQAPYRTGSGTQLPDRPEITGKIYPLLVDTAAPTLSNIATSGITTNGATVGWNTSENAAFQVLYGEATAYGESATHAGFANSRALELKNLKPNTTYHYKVLSWDVYGNLTSGTDRTFTTAAPSSDVTPPTISGIAVSSITTSGATISWNTSEPADSQVEFGATTSYDQTTAINSSLVTGRSIQLTGLVPDMTYHYRVKSRDAAGNLATSNDFTFTTTGVTFSDWGTIDFAELGNLVVSGPESWYRITAVRSGKATVDLAFLEGNGNVDLQVYDANLVLLGSSSSTGNAERVDFDAAGGGTYYVKLTGANTDVDARITNLVAVSGATVNVYGTSGNDSFVFADGSSHQVSVKGVTYSFTPAQLATVSISGGGGNDTLQVTLGSLDDTVVLRPGQITATNSDYSLSGTSLELISTSAGSGFDLASLYDAASDDTLTANPTSAKITGTGFDNTASGFDEVRAYATTGGFDVANLTDGSGNDYFDVGPGSGVIRGPGFFIRGEAFDQYKAYATGGGTDRANLYDGGGNDYFDAGPTSGLLRGSNFYSYAERFESLNAYATAGGIDQAKLYDSAGNDYFDAGPTSAVLRGPSFYSYVERFDKVYAYSQWGGYDVAKLYDGAGNDYFDAGPTSGLMQGNGWYNWADRFDEVIAFATAGGNDIANLYGSAGNDLFTITSNVGRLTGTNYSLRAEQFEQANIRLNQGGTDLAEFRNFLTPDLLYGRTNYARGTVSSKVTTVYDADGIKAYAASGQTPTADVTGIDYLFEKIGTWL